MASVSRLRYEIFERHLEVLVDSPALVEPLRRLFREYAVPAVTQPSNDNVVLTVSADNGVYTVAEGQGSPQRCGTLTELLSVSEFAITGALVSRCTEHLPLHASGAVVNGRGVIALGRAGAGKSSLAIAWHRAGHPALGDDLVLVDEAAMVHPFKRLYEVDAALLSELELDPRETPFWEDGSAEAWYDPADGVGWGEPASASVIAVAQYRHGATLSLEPLPGSATLNFLIHSQFGPVETSAAAADRLAALSGRARGYLVIFGSATEAAAAIAEAASRW